MISVGSEVQVLPGPPSNCSEAEIRSPGGIEKRPARHCRAAWRRVSDVLLPRSGGAVGILSRGGVAQWESTCFASRGSSVRIRPSPFPAAPEGARECAGALRLAMTVDGLVSRLRAATLPKPVPRYCPGSSRGSRMGRGASMFFHMVKMISCVCKWRTSFGRD